MKVVLLLPTYNERESITTLLELLRSAVVSVRNHTIKYLVIDDNSPDGTAHEVRAYQKNHKDVYLITGKKEGLGKALLRGMEYATETLDADIIGQMDGDLSHDPAVLPRFIAAIDNGYDFAIGSRYIPGGSIPSNWGPHRKLFSIFGNAIVRYGLGFSHVHDWTGGYRVYKKQYYESMRNKLESYRGYVFQIAFLHKSIAHGARIFEVPIIFTDRRFGKSKIAPSEYIRDVLLYVIRERWHSIRTGSFGKFCVVGTVGFIINTVVLEWMVREGFHPTIGSIVGAELAIVSNFTLNNIWTFRDRLIVGMRLLEKFIQFNMTSVGAIVIQAGTIAIGTFLFGIPTYRFFYIAGVGFGLIWNYFMYSRVIWKKTPFKT